jgi:anthranilate phosphoribosyltransferase
MPEEHPFAAFIRAIGTGPGRARTLTEDEAFEAAGMVLGGAATQAQAGAFLMLLRYRRETAEELAGFVRAARALIARPDPKPDVDLDWPSYALGRTRGAPYYLLAALLVTQSGVRVLMHGLAAGEPYAGPTAAALAGLGIAPAASTQAAAETLARDRFAFLPLGIACPGLQAVLDLRAQLGLRSPANTVARLLNPFGAAAVFGGVFHPGYRELHQGAAILLGERRLGVLKGGGGESERDPAKPCELFVVEAGGTRTETWPAMIADPRRRPVSAEEAPGLAALWRGDWADEEATAAVTGTAAIALRLAGRAASPGKAESLARDLWARRARDAIREAISQHRGRYP